MTARIAVMPCAAQPICGIALGYEDLVDHDGLRYDPLATLAGKLEAVAVARITTTGRYEMSPDASQLSNWVLPIVIATAVAMAVPASAQEAEGFSMCVVHNSADHPSITALVEGMNAEAPLFGAEITAFDPVMDPQRQASMIEDCIARQADVIVVNAVDPAAVVPGLRKASEAGIPVLMQNADTNEEGRKYTEAFIGVESYDQGYAVGEMIAEEMGGKGNLVVITGKTGQTDVINRSAGMEAAFADTGASFDILASQPADWSKDKALTVMQDLLTRHPDIEVVFAQDDPMALGAIEAIKASGLQGDIKVYGVGGMRDACAAVEAGDLAGTALQLSYMIGVYTVRAAYDLTQGRLVPEQILAPTAPLTAENFAQWSSQCW
jgi:ribose transport system substrate-binding protein